MKLPKTCSFKGVASRSEMWTVYSVFFLSFSITGLVDRLVFGQHKDPGLFGPLVVLLFFLPLWATQVRRWHDRGKSGLWCFLSLVPVIGGIWSFIELGFLPSKGIDLLGKRNLYREYKGVC